MSLHNPNDLRDAGFRNDHTATQDAELPCYFWILQPHKEFFIPQDILESFSQKLPSV
jgi:hypothetical protein